MLKFICAVETTKDNQGYYTATAWMEGITGEKTIPPSNLANAWSKFHPIEAARCAIQCSQLVFEAELKEASGDYISSIDSNNNQ